MTELYYPIPPGAIAHPCLGCDAPIYWIRTAAGKNMPLNEGGSPHWGTCPNADRFKSMEDPGQIIFNFDGGA